MASGAAKALPAEAIEKCRAEVQSNMKFHRLLALGAALWSASAHAAPTVAPSARVERNVVVRSDPTTQSAPLDALDPGEALELVRDLPRWREVRLPDGRTGYVSKAWTVVVAEIGTVLRSHFIDVDQGAATLLEFPCAAILIDAGGRGAAANRHLIEYLEDVFARRPDLERRIAALFITHAHFDHDANLRKVAERFRIGAFITNGASDPRIAGMIEDVVDASPAVPVVLVTDQIIPPAGTSYSDPDVDPIDCPAVDPRVRLLSGGRQANPGWYGREFGNPNNHSLVLRIDHGASSFLFTGDLETPAIDDLVRRYAGTALLDVDVFAVGHHGADNGTTEPMLAAMSPEIAVIPVGLPDTSGIPMSAWDHGHPRTAMFDMLERAISRRRSPAADIMLFEAQEGQPASRRVTDAIYASSRDGDIVIIATSQGTLTVETSR